MRLKSKDRTEQLDTSGGLVQNKASWAELQIGYLDFVDSIFSIQNYSMYLRIPLRQITVRSIMTYQAALPVTDLRPEPRLDECAAMYEARSTPFKPKSVIL